MNSWLRRHLWHRFYSFLRIPWTLILTLFTAGFSLYASYLTIRGTFTIPELATWTVSFLAVYGLLNAGLIVVAQHANVKRNIAVDATEGLHRAIEEIRNYRTLKREEGTYSASRLHDYISLASKEFYEKYIIKQHNGKVRMTVKYLCGSRLYALRIAGYDEGGTANDYESVAEAYLFNILNDRRKHGHLHIPDIENLTREERDLLGEYAHQIRERTRDREYRTFIAIPINTGDERRGQGYRIRRTVGIVGFDQKKEGGFGTAIDTDEGEAHALHAFADAISELVCECDHPEMEAAHSESPEENENDTEH